MIKIVASTNYDDGISRVALEADQDGLDAVNALVEAMSSEGSDVGVLVLPMRTLRELADAFGGVVQ